MSNQNVFADLGLKANPYKIDEADAAAPEKPGLYSIYIDSVDALQECYIRDANTVDQMGITARQTVGKRLRYQGLIADNGLSSGARPAA